MMMLVDTSIWIDHFRRGDPRLVRLLDGAGVATHPFVIGELLLGNVKVSDMIEDLNALPSAIVASADEILTFIAERKLPGQGIGFLLPCSGFWKTASCRKGRHCSGRLPRRSYPGLAW